VSIRPLVLLAVAALAAACDRTPRHPVEIDLSTFGAVLRNGVARDLSVETAGGIRRIAQPAGEPFELAVRAPHRARLRFGVSPGTPDDAFAVTASVGTVTERLAFSAVTEGEREAGIPAEEGDVVLLRFESRGPAPLAWWAPRVTGTARAAAPILDPAVRPPPGPLHVVVLVVDALRADHLSLYGYRRPTSPELARLAGARGVVFERAYATGPSTPNSIPSLFTGRPPSALGINFRAGAGRATRTLAEALALAGVRTAAFVGNPLLLETLGYGRGFGAYEILRREDSKVHFVPSALLVDRALEYLSVNRDAPCFVYLQAMETHTPFDPSPAHRGRFEPDATRPSSPRRPPAERSAAPAPRPGPWARGGDDAPADARDPDRYDEAIATVDEQIARLVRGFQDLGLADRTALVVTADHGEALGTEDDGSWLHGHSLFEELVHVPLVLWLPWLDHGRRVGEIVSLLDLGATLLDLAGIAAPDGFGGASWLRPQPGLDPSEALLERLAPHWDAHEVRGRGVYGVAEWGLRQGPWKLVMDDRRVRLFHLPSDPKETRDVAAMHPEMTAYLAGRVARLSPGLARHGDGPAVIDPGGGVERDLTDALKALGYVSP
jgi:arylsulfatase A-like enzyme